jgi:hypothetical protein
MLPVPLECAALVPMIKERVFPLFFFFFFFFFFLFGIFF